jgi:hypothetical protein
MPSKFPPDRYEAAIRLERARQHVRELGRCGGTVTEVDANEVRQAEREYDRATRWIAFTE